MTLDKDRKIVPAQLASPMPETFFKHNFGNPVAEVLLLANYNR